MKQNSILLWVILGIGLFLLTFLFKSKSKAVSVSPSPAPPVGDTAPLGINLALNPPVLSSKNGMGTDSNVNPVTTMNDISPVTTFKKPIVNQNPAPVLVNNLGVMKSTLNTNPYSIGG